VPPASILFAPPAAQAAGGQYFKCRVEDLNRIDTRLLARV